MGQSEALGVELRAQWTEAEDAYERSLAEMRLLGAAAADLAIAERLLRTSVAAELGPVPMRGSHGRSGSRHYPGAAPAGDLDRACSFSRYRSSSELQNLQAGAFACLDGIRKDTVAAGKDAIIDMLTMDFALLKEAAELLGADIAAKLRDSAVGLLRTAVEYVLAATDKLRLLLGAEGETRVKQAVLDFVDQLREDRMATQAVERFLHTEAIYEETKGWMQAYDGDPQALVTAAAALEALRGSFAGRRKLIEVVIRGSPPPGSCLLCERRRGGLSPSPPLTWLP